MIITGLFVRDDNWENRVQPKKGFPLLKKKENELFNITHPF
jgi:hypothetical protein